MLLMYGAGVTELKIHDKWDATDPSAGAMIVEDCPHRVGALKELRNDRVRNFKLGGGTSIQVIQNQLLLTIVP